MSGYSIWLDLEKESRSSYRKIISTLSNRLDSPFFEPHCTIYGHMNINLEDLKAIITKLVLKNNQFSTSAKKIIIRSRCGSNKLAQAMNNYFLYN